MEMILQGASSLETLGAQFSQLLYAAEVRYLIEHEWAMSADDILFRRTKHGLHMNDQELLEFRRWIEHDNAKSA